MATPAADPQSIVHRVRNLARSALFQASRPALDRSVVGGLMHAAEQLMAVADQLDAELNGEAVRNTKEPLVFDVPPSRARET